MREKGEKMDRQIYRNGQKERKENDYERKGRERERKWIDRYVEMDRKRGKRMMRENGEKGKENGQIDIQKQIEREERE